MIALLLARKGQPNWLWVVGIEENFVGSISLLSCMLELTNIYLLRRRG